jgi:hypothetical protein
MSRIVICILHRAVEGIKPRWTSWPGQEKLYIYIHTLSFGQKISTEKSSWEEWLKIGFSGGYTDTVVNVLDVVKCGEFLDQLSNY